MQNKVRETFILIPPFDEQQLVGTLLATLTNSQNAEELSENGSRISQYFDTLFTAKAITEAPIFRTIGVNQKK